MEHKTNQNRCVTHSEKEECSLIWTIQDFSHLDEEIDRILKSSIFFSHSVEPKARWNLLLYPFETEAKSNVGLYLQNNESCQNKTRARCTFSIIDKNKKECLIRSFDNIFVNDVGRGYNNYITRDALLKNKELLPNDSITISCKVCVLIKTDMKQIPFIHTDQNEIKQPSFLPLLESKMFSDVTLEVENKTIAVHKIILSIYSDVFQAMFNSKMAEQKTNEVKIKDLSFQTVAGIIRFMYSGEAPPFGKTTEDLLKAADIYNVKSLISEIENQIVDNIDLETACDLLIVSNT